jgi:uncharacterized cupin superfamily protein
MNSARFRKLATIVAVILFGLSVAAVVFSQDDIVRPAKMSRADIEGGIFDRADMLRTEHDDGHVTLDVTSLKSSDGRFASGMYRSSKVRFEIDEPYGVDEFMYFLEGSVTLTSADGSVQEIGAGEAVTIPKEWTGTWDTDGYTKIWVIYSEDGSGL